MVKLRPTKPQGPTPEMLNDSNAVLDQAANENERQTRVVMENISQGVVMYNSARRVVIWNKQYEDIFQYPKSFLCVGLSNDDIVRYLVRRGDYGVGDEEELFQERTKTVWSGKASQYEVDVLGNKTYEVVARPTDDGGWVTTYANITERKKADEAIKRSEARFRDYADVASDWYWEQDSDLRFTSTFDGDTSISATGGEYYYGKPRRETNLLDVTEDQLLAHEALLLARKPFSDFRFSRIGQDGVKIYYSVSGRPFFDSDNNFMGYRGAGRNITERVNSEIIIKSERDRAEAASLAKSQFLANMSHELRTPLNAIIGYSQMIRDEIMGELNNPVYIDYSNDIHDSGQHLLTLINDILDLSKVEAGKFDVNETVNNVEDIFESVRKLIQIRSNSKDHNLKIKIAPNLPQLRADNRLIFQVILNLLTNAVKFTPDGGKVTLSAHVDKSGAMVIRVTDTGIGIAAHDIEKVIEPFGQVRNTPELSSEGTGLGLPLSKKFVELHGGTLLIESEAEKGTTATIRFPTERTVKE